MASAGLREVEQQLAAAGFKKRAGQVLTLEVDDGVLGWLGLNRATRHRPPGEFEVNPVPGGTTTARTSRAVPRALSVWLCPTNSSPPWACSGTPGATGVMQTIDDFEAAVDACSVGRFRRCCGVRTRPDPFVELPFGTRCFLEVETGPAAFLTPDSYRAGDSGRDLSVGTDPLTANRYSYVNGDPVNLVDPDGHSAARYREFCRANEVDDERCGRMTTQWEKVRSDTAAKERRRYLAAQRAKKKDCNWTCRLKRGAGGALGDFDAFAEGFTETFAEAGEAAVDRAKFLAQCVPGYGSAERCLAVAQEAAQHLERATGPGGPTAAVLAPVHQVVVETVRPVVEDVRKGHYSKAAGRVTANVVMAAGPGAAAKAGIAAKAARAPNTAGLADDAIRIKPGSAGGTTSGQRFPSSVRREALEENPSTCVYCRMETNAPQVDHAIPLSRGGNATLDNAQTTCPWCNASKGARNFPVNPPPGYRGPWPPWWW